MKYRDVRKIIWQSFTNFTLWNNRAYCLGNGRFKNYKLILAGIFLYSHRRPRSRVLDGRATLQRVG